MSITQKPTPIRAQKIKLDLTGPDGNAMVIMATCKSLARQLGWDQEEIQDLLNKQMNGDYTNVIRLADQHFGAFLEMQLDEATLKAINEDIAERNSEELVDALAEEL
jgi:hypothetical protein